MKKRCLTFLLVALSAVAFAQTSTSNQETKRDGYWWEKQSQDYRVGFLSGYLIGLARAGDTVVFMCLADNNGGKIPAQYPGKDAFSKWMEKPAAKALDYGSFRLGQWYDGVNEFFKDFRNKGLDVQFALGYVKEQLKGTPAKELEEMVEAARRNAAGVKQ